MGVGRYSCLGAKPGQELMCSGSLKRGSGAQPPEAIDNFTF